MTAFRHVSLMLSLFIIAAGCGKSQVNKRSKNDNITLSGHEAVILEDQGLELTDAHMKGTGKFVFIRPVKKIASNQSFRIVTSIEEGGYSDFRTYAFSRLSGGLSLRFSKTDNQLQIEFGDGTQWDAPVPLASDATQPLQLTIDVDNSATPSVVSVFNGLSSLRRTEDLLYRTPENPDPLRHGFGGYYGFVLSDASLDLFEIPQ